MARPGWSDTLHENTRPRVSPTYTVRWSLQIEPRHQIQFTSGEPTALSAT
jgi:hypothetical protein